MGPISAIAHPGMPLQQQQDHQGRLTSEFFSSTNTSQPARASRPAVARPPTPAPMITTLVPAAASAWTARRRPLRRCLRLGGAATPASQLPARAGHLCIAQNWPTGIGGGLASCAPALCAMVWRSSGCATSAPHAGCNRTGSCWPCQVEQPIASAPTMDIKALEYTRAHYDKHSNQASLWAVCRALGACTVHARRHPARMPPAPPLPCSMPPPKTRSRPVRLAPARP